MYNQPTKRFAKRLAEFLCSGLTTKPIKEAHLTINGQLVIEFEDGSKKLKKIPGNLSEEKLAALERRLVLGQLILEGYRLQKVQNGYRCINKNGKEYYMQEETCECEDFAYNLGEQEPCKHLLFKDAFLEMIAEFYGYTTS